MRKLSCADVGRVTAVRDPRGDITTEQRATGDEPKIIPPELPSADFRKVSVARDKNRFCATFEMQGAPDVPTRIDLGLDSRTVPPDLGIVFSFGLGRNGKPLVHVTGAELDRSQFIGGQARVEVVRRAVRLIVPRGAFPGDSWGILEAFEWQAHALVDIYGTPRYVDCSPARRKWISHPGGRIRSRPHGAFCF